MPTIEETKNQMDQLMHDCGVPEHMRDGLTEYILQGRPPGGFLAAVLENNLMEAFGRADDKNQRSMMAYAMYLYNYAPSTCWGGSKQVEQWMAQGGLLGQSENSEGV